MTIHRNMLCHQLLGLLVSVDIAFRTAISIRFAWPQVKLPQQWALPHQQPEEADEEVCRWSVEVSVRY